MANLPYIADQIRLQVNKPDSVDWVSAMQGFTGPDAHPVELFKAFVAAGVLPNDWKPDFDRQAELVVRTEEDVDSRFAMLLEEHPTLVKAFLSHSEDYDRNLQGPPERAQMRGMDPRLLPHLVMLAHSAGLKVAVHAYTVSDFRTVVASGADEVAHLPGSGYRPHDGVREYLITIADARAAARAGVVVDTSASWLNDLRDEDSVAYEIARNQIIIPNIALLKEAGVKLIVGSDAFRQDTLTELGVLRELGAFSNIELIRMATVETPMLIFPHRKIGRLADRYEANFLALRADPTTNLQNLSSLTMLVKGGVELSLPAKMHGTVSGPCIQGDIGAN